GDRRPDRVADGAREDGRRGLVGVGRDDRELVAAEARGLMPQTEEREDALARDAQQLVARRVAEAVVHVLEAIEVEHEERRLALRDRERGLEAPRELGAIWQAGERVAQARILDLAARLRLLGEIEREADVDVAAAT